MEHSVVAASFATSAEAIAAKALLNSRGIECLVVAPEVEPLFGKCAIRIHVAMADVTRAREALATTLAT